MQDQQEQNYRPLFPGGPASIISIQAFLRSSASLQIRYLTYGHMEHVGPRFACFVADVNCNLR